jgi:hypothetical protein
MHLGSNFRDPNANAGPSKWDDIRGGGYTTIHAGSNYGYDTVVPLKSAFDPNPQQHTAFAAMNDEDWPLGPLGRAH